MKVTNSEKLILLMLCDIYRHLKIDGELDPDFIASAILDEQTWGLEWRYPGVFGGSSEPTPEIVEHTADYLEMWDMIEDGYESLSTADKARVAAEAEPFGTDVRFRGFDGNHEDEFGVAQFLVKKLERFSRFEGRDLNSHSPSVDSYARMYRVYEPMRSKLTRGLSATQIIDLLKARRHPNHRP